MFYDDTLCHHERQSSIRGSDEQNEQKTHKEKLKANQKKRTHRHREHWKLTITNDATVVKQEAHKLVETHTHTTPHSHIQIVKQNPVQMLFHTFIFFSFIVFIVAKMVVSCSATKNKLG